MSKSKLKKIVLDYGLHKPLKKIDKRNYTFSILRESEHPFDCLADYSYVSLFPDMINQIASERFSPITIGCDTESLLFISQLLNSARFANLIELNPEVITQGEIKSALDICKTQNTSYNKSLNMSNFLSTLLKPSSLEKKDAQMSIFTSLTTEEPNENFEP